MAQPFEYKSMDFPPPVYSADTMPEPPPRRSSAPDGAGQLRTQSSSAGGGSSSFGGWSRLTQGNFIDPRNQMWISLNQSSYIGCVYACMRVRVASHSLMRCLSCVIARISQILLKQMHACIGARKIRSGRTPKALQEPASHECVRPATSRHAFLLAHTHESTPTQTLLVPSHTFSLSLPAHHRL